MNRSDILDTAKGYVCADRNSQYGEPEDSFRQIACLWTNYMDGVLKIDRNNPNGAIWNGFMPSDVAAMMALMKIARISNNPTKADSWIDAAGYLACGGEVATK